MSPPRQASRRRPKSQPSQPLPGWLWGLGGLLCGVLITVWMFVDSQGDAELIGAQDAAELAPAEGAVRPRFEFYTLLPELEVVVPEAPTRPRAADEPPAPPAAVERPGTYILQAGSFRSTEEADRMRASLALLGVQSNVQAVTVNADTWHRVRIGPFTDLGELNQMRDRLHRHDIQTLMVRLATDA